MICVPPARFEFGVILRYHVPAVAAIKEPFAIVHEPGLEALYPTASTRIFCNPRADERRKDTYGKDAEFVAAWERNLRHRFPNCKIFKPERTKRHPEVRFVPQPYSLEDLPDPYDVVVCPRWRTVAPDRNWMGWLVLADALDVEGYSTIAAGKPDQLEFWGGRCAAAYSRYLDASIHSMLNAKLVIATDSGLAHLAVLCRRPLLLITHEGYPSPNHRHRPRFKEYYYSVAHAPVVTIDAWDDPGKVVRKAKEILDG